MRKFAFVVLLALAGGVGGPALGQAPATGDKPKPAPVVQPSPEVLPMPKADGEEAPAALDGNPKPNPDDQEPPAGPDGKVKPNPDDEEPPAGPDPVSKPNPTTLTPGCPCPPPCPPPCPVPCPPPCGGVGDVVNISKASQVTGKLQIQGTGTFAPGAGRVLKEVDIVAVNTATGTRYTFKASTIGADWSVPNLTIPAGTYNVSAQIITTNLCGGGATATPSNPNQTIKVTVSP